MSNKNRNADAELKDLIHLLGHDVRNSVRALVEVPKWIHEDLEDSEVKLPSNVSEHLEILTTQANRLEKMIDDLLVYSKFQKPDVSGLIDLETSVRKLIAKTRLPSGFAVQCDLRCADVHIGQEDFDAILTELLNNAVKHHNAPQGKITIVAQATDAAFEMTVADDGAGVSDQHAEKIFLPMKTLRPRDEVEGSGMGLSIARRIVEGYGGTLTVKGSVFRISIPQSEAYSRLVG